MKIQNQGPWTHRILIYVFTGLFGLLTYWLIGFLMDDIGNRPGPIYKSVEQRIIDPALPQTNTVLLQNIEQSRRNIEILKGRQTVLRDSTSNSEKTMNQLLELQKQNLQRNIQPSAEETCTLSSSERLFLANQTKYQEINVEIATLNEQLSKQQDLQRELQGKAEAKRSVVEEVFQKETERFQIKLAAYKLAVLLPGLSIVIWLFLKKRSTLYVQLIYGGGIAVVIQVGEVIHEHFPTPYFKYTLIGLSLIGVARVLIYLLRLKASPKLDWLLKQYREAYEHFLCPVCSYPIRIGPLRFMTWTRGNARKLNTYATGATEEVYTCPACSTRIFEECPQCKHIRHSMLPACGHCGANKEMVSQPGKALS